MMLPTIRTCICIRIGLCTPTVGVFIPLLALGDGEDLEDGDLALELAVKLS